MMIRNVEGRSDYCKDEAPEFFTVEGRKGKAEGSCSLNHKTGKVKNIDHVKVKFQLSQINDVNRFRYADTL